MTDAELRARAETMWTIVQAQGVAAGEPGPLALKADPALEQVLKASFINGYVASALDRRWRAA